MLFRSPTSFGFDRALSQRSITDDANWKYYMFEHAERNAIYKALKMGHMLRGATMYGTLFPCADCARAIVAAEITRIVVPAPGSDPIRDEKWRMHYKYATKIFELSEVKVEQYLLQDFQ